MFDTEEKVKTLMQVAQYREQSVAFQKRDLTAGETAVLKYIAPCVSKGLDLLNPNKKNCKKHLIHQKARLGHQQQETKTCHVNITNSKKPLRTPNGGST